MKTVINYDAYVEAIENSALTNVRKLSHKDAFALIDENEKTLCYFHVRKYSVDVYVKDSMTKTLSDKKRFDCSSKNFSKIFVESEAELVEALLTINSDYQKSLKKSTKKSDTTKK